jgi:uncharacterized protein (TIGR03066 family)
MNEMRLLAVGAIVCLLGASAVADETKPDYSKLIVGKWECTKSDPGTLPVGSGVEFTKDGKMLLNMKMGDQALKMEGTYKLAGDKFDMAFKMGDQEHKQTITIKKLDDTTMSTADGDGKAVVLTRKK